MLQKRQFLPAPIVGRFTRLSAQKLLWSECPCRRVEASYEHLICSKIDRPCEIRKLSASFITVSSERLFVTSNNCKNKMLEYYRNKNMGHLVKQICDLVCVFSIRRVASSPLPSPPCILLPLFCGSPGWYAGAPMDAEVVQEDCLVFPVRHRVAHCREACSTAQDVFTEGACACACARPTVLFVVSSSRWLHFGRLFFGRGKKNYILEHIFTRS